MSLQLYYIKNTKKKKMSKEKVNEISDELVKKITEYVYKNYADHYNKNLIIRDCDTHYKILKHIDGGPLILGKSIV